MLYNDTSTLHTQYHIHLHSLYNIAIVPATYIPPLEFSAYVKELHKDADKGFNIQFNSLEENSATSLPCNVAVRQENSAKNRYHNILPCKLSIEYENDAAEMRICVYNHCTFSTDDSTRIVLSKTEKRHSDYINASWINVSTKTSTQKSVHICVDTYCTHVYISY